MQMLHVVDDHGRIRMARAELPREMRIAFDEDGRGTAAVDPAGNDAAADAGHDDAIELRCQLRHLRGGTLAKDWSRGTNASCDGESLYVAHVL
jgi:hypothetical protein